MVDKAKEVVREYAVSHLVSKCISEDELYKPFNVFVVWQCKTLQNWKFLISTDLKDNMYYEVTYNGDKKEWYLDAYQKVENVCIKEE